MSLHPSIATATLRDIAGIAQQDAAAPARCPFGHGSVGGNGHGSHGAHPAASGFNLAVDLPAEAVTLPGPGGLPGMQHATFVDRLLLVGMTHRKGDALWLERMSIPHDELPGVLGAIKARPGIAQAMILSTCNRTELYVLLEHDAKPQAVFIAMNAVRPAWGDLPAEQLDIKKGWAAVEHLFAVTSGLEALILGETEITAQVKCAIDLAQQLNAAGAELVSLVQQALRTTKKVRNNTRVSTGTLSVGSAAAHLALAAHDARADRAPIVVIGAGVISEQVIRTFARVEFKNFVVINRNLEKAKALAERYGGVAASLEDLYPTLARSCAVVAAVSVAEPIVIADRFETHTEGDGHYTFIDLCIPRAIDHRLGERDNRTVLGLPAVRKHLDEHIALRTLDEPLARQIVAEEVRRFRGRVLQQFLVPLIRHLQERSEEITRARLDRYVHDHGASPAVDKWAHSLKGELLDMFLTSMRDAMISGNCPLGPDEQQAEKDAAQPAPAKHAAVAAGAAARGQCPH